VFNWNDIRILLEVARVESVSGAAKVLKIDGSTVSRRINALETALGVKCLERSGGRIQLTHEGRTIVGKAGRMEEAAAEIEQSVHPDQTEAAGRVRIATTRTMTQWVLFPVIETLARTHPHITIEVDSQVQRADIMKRDADLALTPYEATVDHPRLIRRLVCVLTYGLFAAPEYFADNPWTPEKAFEGHHLMGIGKINADQTSAGKWWTDQIGDAPVAFRTSSAEELLQLCTDGRGLAPVFCFRAHQRNLLPVPGIAHATLPHWIVVHPDLQHMTRMRVVVDALLARIAEIRSMLEHVPATEWTGVVELTSEA